MVMFGGKKCLLLPVLMLVALFQIGSERPRQIYDQLAGTHQIALVDSGSDTGGEANEDGQAVDGREDQQNQNNRQHPLLSPQTIDISRRRQRLCSNEEIVHGRWVPVTLERPPYIPLSPRVRCLRPDAFSKPFPTWQWQPHDKCNIVSLDSHQFCRLLSNGTIAFIGDSLTLEHYASLVHLLGDRARLPPKAVQHGRIRRHICASPSVDNNNLNEHPIPTPPPDHCVDLVFKTDFFLQNITQEVSTSMPRVMVLNRGAHYTSDTELTQSLQQFTFPALKEWDQKCQDANMACLLIWRTTVPGHPYCQNFAQPSNSVPDMESWIHDKSTKDVEGGYRKGEYHWQDFQRQNLLVSRLLQDEWSSLLPHIEIHVMDSYQPNILRPDSHRSHMGDCLHSCSPGGGSDLNSQWLYHILVQQQQKQN